MSDRRRSAHSHHQRQAQQQQSRQAFEDKCRVLEDELRRQNETIDALRNESILSNQPNDLSRSTCLPNEQSLLRNTSQRSSVSSHWNVLAKDREIAKLKALIFQKDNELIALTTANKTALLQMEERMERERKVWNEHKELLIAGERAKFEEEKTRLLKDLHEQVKLEQDRIQRLEQKLYETQMQSSEAQLMLKESGRERINAVYSTKEQCRKEFQDEITRLRNQFQLEKDGEFLRLQERIHELESKLDLAASDNADGILRQQEVFLSLEAAEKNCVRSICDCVKKLLMAMDSPSQVYTTIPQITSFTYDRESLVERLPTRNVLKLLQDTVDEVRNYIVEQKYGWKRKRNTSRNPKSWAIEQPSIPMKKIPVVIPIRYRRKFLFKRQKENDYYFRDIDRLSQTHENHHHQHYPYRSQHALQLSSEQTETIDNLVQKLEDHIASELDRLTKQRLTLNGTNSSDERSTSFPLEAPKR